ncbi:MAG TPA: polysaccharide ABC transporter ATP-binding protein [Nitrospiraceae bacterium]|nr:polysaccharide ABC transporter ATP-binding protein [Nitrospiraceae bacterium]
MADIAIRVENISKQYTLGVRSHTSLRDLVSDHLRMGFCRPTRANGRAPASETTIWALKDVSFEVQRGEFLSIVGANGSGKSTLLKVLSRITEPTEGRAEIHGTVGSLLEVGTGFVPELSGRENIYLNGAILGMKKAAIDARFDEIVAFAEIDKFIDTPVKRYSSGMYVRLAFAVAAHLEPEILIVDEVLSVGDAAFQKKCIGKMEDVTKSGRTILFVSHNMAAVTTLSTSAILLHRGQIIYRGSPLEVVQAYMDKVPMALARVERNLAPSSDAPFTITAVRTMDDEDKPAAVFRRSGGVVVEIEGLVHERQTVGGEYLIAVDVKTAYDMMLFRTHNIEYRECAGIPRDRGAFILRCVLPPNLFPAGTYRIGIHTAVAGKRDLEYQYPVLEFDLVQDQLLCDLFTGIAGLLTPRCEWRLTYADASQPSASLSSAAGDRDRIR